MAYYIGVDVGGTNIACGIVNDDCQIIARSKVKTGYGDKGGPPEYSVVLENVKEAVRKACSEAGILVSDAKCIGIGCPGICNNETGLVEYCSNLGFENVPLRDDVEKAFNLPTYLENDANAAAFGEFVAGGAKGSKNAVVITLGTGVGSGIIIDEKIYRGSYCAGGEIGHTVIVMDGLPCSCGRKGCFEAYSSATGLVRMR
ncbi:MAG: ROK family protein, partial [Oscillospiraceae bacterium]